MASEKVTQQPAILAAGITPNTYLLMSVSGDGGSTFTSNKILASEVLQYIQNYTPTLYTQDSQVVTSGGTRDVDLNGNEISFEGINSGNGGFVSIITNTDYSSGGVALNVINSGSIGVVRGIQSVAGAGTGGYFSGTTGIDTRSQSASGYALKITPNVIGAGAIISDGHQRNSATNAVPSLLTYQFLGNGTTVNDLNFQIGNGVGLSTQEWYGNRQSKFYGNVGINQTPTASEGLTVSGSNAGIFATGDYGAALYGTSVGAQLRGSTVGCQVLMTSDSNSAYYIEAISMNSTGALNARGRTVLDAPMSAPATSVSHIVKGYGSSSSFSIATYQNDLNAYAMNIRSDLNIEMFGGVTLSGLQAGSAGLTTDQVYYDTAASITADPNARFLAIRI